MLLAKTRNKNRLRGKNSTSKTSTAQSRKRRTCTKQHPGKQKNKIRKPSTNRRKAKKRKKSIQKRMNVQRETEEQDKPFRTDTDPKRKQTEEIRNRDQRAGIRFTGLWKKRDTLKPATRQQNPPSPAISLACDIAETGLPSQTKEAIIESTDAEAGDAKDDNRAIE